MDLWSHVNPIYYKDINIQSPKARIAEQIAFLEHAERVRGLRTAVNPDSDVSFSAWHRFKLQEFTLLNPV